jgi:hypothetical protein
MLRQIEQVRLTNLLKMLLPTYCALTTDDTSSQYIGQPEDDFVVYLESRIEASRIVSQFATVTITCMTYVITIT